MAQQMAQEMARRTLTTRLLTGLVCVAACLAGTPCSAQNDGLSESAVLNALKLGRESLVTSQLENGSWHHNEYPVGATALVTLALLNAGASPDDRPVRRALEYLRNNSTDAVYEISLELMVFSFVKDSTDRIRMKTLVKQLEDGQLRGAGRRDETGCWAYKVTGHGTGDHSNGQFAVLGLFEAANAGIAVDRKTWERADDHWRRTQNPDGGWGYSPAQDNNSIGSMTVAGIASLIMTSAMLQKDDDLDSGGIPDCCATPAPDENLQRGLRWLTQRFTVDGNPGSGRWPLYFLYGLERAGRLSGQRFFGDHDWYRRGARILVERQELRTGAWQGQNEQSVNTSFVLLFLSKGLAPVVINKLQFATKSNDPLSWDRHHYDIRNLTDRITGSERWPKLLTWQVVNMETLRDHGTVADLSMAPILYLSSAERPEFTDREVDLLKQHVNLGGFILAVNNCQKTEFRDGVFELVERMYPEGEARLEKLKPSHPIYQSEYPLDGSTVELWGADFGCRTAIVYAPDDLACLWNRWSRLEPPNRPAEFKLRVERSMRVGMNIVAYATGREPVSKLKRAELAAEEDKSVTIRRGLLQVAQVRHIGGWNTASHAARNLMLALNRAVGLTARTEPGTVTLSSNDIFDYSMLMMHGRQTFTTSAEEREHLRNYLSRGRVLFADACCGAPQFDRAFREFMKQLYPGRSLERISPDDELFTSEFGYDISRARRRAPEAAGRAAIEGILVTDKPFLEGIRIGGRYVVIYSKYDISCALERQASVACTGYVPEDAAKIAVNVVLYSKLKAQQIDP
jgi:hypothetical protein